MAVNVRRKSELLEKVALFNRKVEEHHEKQLSNPFSDVERPADFTFKKIDVHDPNYGRPLAGSKTAIRGQEASEHLRKELKVLCEVINDCGHKMRDGRAAISFGQLFSYYNAISDKCVGNLMSARKHKLVAFEGEMLYQRRDDETIITLTQPYEELLKLPIMSGAPAVLNPSPPPAVVKKHSLTDSSKIPAVPAVPEVPENTSSLQPPPAPMSEPSPDQVRQPIPEIPSGSETSKCEPITLPVMEQSNSPAEVQNIVTLDLIVDCQPVESTNSVQPVVVDQAVDTKPDENLLEPNPTCVNTQTDVDPTNLQTPA